MVKDRQQVEALVESRSLRDHYADKVEALERVGKMTMLPDDLHVTIEMAAGYYKVEKIVLDLLISRHRDELITDGYKVLRSQELKQFKQGYLQGVSNLKFITQLALLPRRAVLRIGMLLRDSEVAKDIRSYLLNVEERVRTEAPMSKIGNMNPSSNKNNAPQGILRGLTW